MGPGRRLRSAASDASPIAVAVIVAIVILVLLPNGIRPGPRRALVLGALLAALIVAGPGRVDRRTRLPRLLSVFP